MSWTDGPLMLSSYTLGTRGGFADRVAAEAGHAGVGLRAENYWQALEATGRDGARSGGAG